MVCGIETHPVSPLAPPPTEGEYVTRASVATVGPPIAEQARWDGRDANARALIALSVERDIIPTIRSCKTARDAWDNLANLYQVRNGARVAYLKRKLKTLPMLDGDSMDDYLTKVKDLREQLVSVDEIIPDASLVSTVLQAIPDMYQNVSTTIKLLMKGNPNSITFDELVSVLLHEEQSRHNRIVMCVADQAFIASQKGKGKATFQGGNKPKKDAGQPSGKDAKEGDKPA